jgi:hypothetical protein
MPSTVEELYAAVEEGLYSPRFAYPTKPAPLRVDLAVSLKLRAAAEEQREDDYKRACQDWQQETNRRAADFERDLFKVLELPSNSPFAHQMYAIAYQRGHACGFADVVTAMLDLMPLWDHYALALKSTPQSPK